MCKKFMLITYSSLRIQTSFYPANLTFVNFFDWNVAFQASIFWPLVSARLSETIRVHAWQFLTLGFSVLPSIGALQEPGYWLCHSSTLAAKLWIEAPDDADDDLTVNNAPRLSSKQKTWYPSFQGLRLGPTLSASYRRRAESRIRLGIPSNHWKYAHG